MDDEVARDCERCDIPPALAMALYDPSVHSGRVGNRYSPPGVDALYLGLSRATALAEYTNGIGNDVAMRPSSMVNVQINLGSFIKLGKTFLKKLGLTADDVCRHRTVGGHSLTQRLGQLAFKERLDGLVYPSAVHRGH
jgi:RES domain-containing protein